MYIVTYLLYYPNKYLFPFGKEVEIGIHDLTLGCILTVLCSSHSLFHLRMFLPPFISPICTYNFSSDFTFINNLYITLLIIELIWALPCLLICRFVRSRIRIEIPVYVNLYRYSTQVFLDNLYLTRFQGCVDGNKAKRLILRCKK